MQKRCKKAHDRSIHAPAGPTMTRMTSTANSGTSTQTAAAMTTYTSFGPGTMLFRGKRTARSEDEKGQHR